MALEDDFFQGEGIHDFLKVCEKNDKRNQKIRASGSWFLGRLYLWKYKKQAVSGW